mgnify:CR=1 FL=1
MAAYSGQLAKYRPIYVSCIASVHSQWPSAFWCWVCSSFKAICATHVLCDHICPPCYLPILSNTHCLQTSPVYIQLSHISRLIQYAIKDSTLHLNSMHCHSVPISLWGFNTPKHTCHFVITPHLETYHIYFLLGSLYPEIKPNKIEKRER